MNQDVYRQNFIKSGSGAGSAVQCPRCRGDKNISKLTSGRFECGKCSGYQFSVTSSTLMHHQPDFRAYFKAALLAYIRVGRGVQREDLKKYLQASNESKITRIRNTVYNAMQPPVKVQGSETKGLLCGVGRVDYTLEYKTKKMPVKVFLVCDLSTNFRLSFAGYNAPFERRVGLVRYAYYPHKENHEWLLKTFFHPLKGRQRCMFFCPDDNKFQYNKVNEFDSTGFYRTSFRHGLSNIWPQYQDLVKMITNEEEHLLSSIQSFNGPFKEFGYYLCEQAFLRNNPPENRRFHNLLKALVTPMDQRAAAIQRQLQPGRGMKKPASACVPIS
ncbi:hypothetical protein [Desulfopila aestuarii]|uniref:Transposase zinc-ribbon domain-containing protein n=1 Tax=Desulfopila aestuarii DSM 18488 TaxID=1121416 RepID=A0A1M7YK67_9BACT|nr:hypothetical protein [Desulfopila aestuarii]SHO52992.1 hypothetical protein SAMN02745220_04875 [Desulfopila aestuarii DSM 18488]